MTPRLAFAFTLVLIASSCATPGSAPVVRLGKAQLLGADGQAAGTAVLAASAEQITLTITTSGLPEGQHGLHLHTAGKCEAPTFASAGAHLNPLGHQHGSANPLGSHLGDLPNLVVGSNGTGTLTAQLGASRAAVEAALFDTDGTAIVIHAAPDDYRTDPTGNSGARIACGVLAR